jgi:hypothetical protein
MQARGNTALIYRACGIVAMFVCSVKIGQFKTTFQFESYIFAIKVKEAKARV